MFYLNAMISDKRLYGDTVLYPFSASCQLFRSAISSFPGSFSTTTKVAQCVKQLFICIGLTFSLVITAPLGLVGIVCKWIDLSIRINQFAHKSAAITYRMPIYLKYFSRLGDHLVNYLHAKYIAQEKNIDLLFTPFKQADFFQFSQDEKLVDNPEAPVYFKNVVYISSKAGIDRIDPSSPSTLYVLPYYPESVVETSSPNYCGIVYPIDWKAFRPKVQSLMRVIKPYNEIDIPNDCVSVAMHIRTGGTFDSPHIASILPAKLPPRSFYLGELKKLLQSDSFPSKAVYIHIFTDEPDPTTLKNWLEDELKRWKIAQKVQVDCAINPSLVDDIANMVRFQYLIRADSNLSGTLSKASDVLQEEIFPSHVTINSDATTITIDEVATYHSNDATMKRSPTNYVQPVITHPLLPHKFYGYLHRSIL